MSLPNLSGVGRLVEDPQLRFSQSGTAVCSVNLAFNSRRKNAAGEWEDGDSFFVRGTAFKEMAESMAESLTRGCEVVVSGRLKLDRWEDKQTGEKRSAPSLLIDAIGPNLRYATADVKKADRSGGFGGGKSAPADDPWGQAPPATGGGFDETPPF